MLFKVLAPQIVGRRCGRRVAAHLDHVDHQTAAHVGAAARNLGEAMARVEFQRGGTFRSHVGAPDGIARKFREEDRQQRRAHAGVLHLGKHVETRDVHPVGSRMRAGAADDAALIIRDERDIARRQREHFGCVARRQRLDQPFDSVDAVDCIVGRVPRGAIQRDQFCAVGGIVLGADDELHSVTGD